VGVARVSPWGLNQYYWYCTRIIVLYSTVYCYYNYYSTVQYHCIITTTTSSTVLYCTVLYSTVVFRRSSDGFSDNGMGL
jgi:hypothetical protein